MVAVALAVRVVPELVVLAVIVTLPPGGGTLGAVYKPVESIEPTFPPFVELTDQVTAEVIVPFKVAVNWCVPPAGTLACVGVTEIPVTPPNEIVAAFEVTVVLLVPLVEVLSTMIAVILTLVDGAVCGAV